MRIKVDNRFKWKYLKYTIISIASLLVFIGIWALATNVLQLAPSYALPSPDRVFNSFIRKWTSAAPEGSTLGQHLIASTHLAITALLYGSVAGITVGVLMGWYKPVEIMLRPLVDFIRPIPPIAVIPVMIMLFGIGIEARRAVIFLGVFNITLLNSYAGIRQTKDIHLWVSRTFGASNLQQLFTVAIPSAIPMIFAGLRVAMGVAWASLVAAEMLAASRGLGFMIHISRALARPDLVIVGMIVLGVICLTLAKLFDFIEKRFVKGGY